VIIIATRNVTWKARDFMSPFDGTGGPALALLCAGALGGVEDEAQGAVSRLDHLTFHQVARVGHVLRGIFLRSISEV
jgi:hypothetical protein